MRTMNEIREEHGSAVTSDLDTPLEENHPLAAAIRDESGRLALDGKDVPAYEYLALLVRSWAGGQIPLEVKNRDTVADDVARIVAAGIWPYIVKAASQQAVELLVKAVERTGADPAALGWHGPAFQDLKRGPVLRLGRDEALAVHEALYAAAGELRRKAGRRSAAGPENKRHRETLRASAEFNENLARRIGREHGFSSNED